jgi:hypothetical protein
MTRNTIRAGALAALAVFVGISAATVVARADEPAAADAAKDGEAKDWAEHMGDIPFLVGRAAGDAEADFTGKPPMYFFTTTW